MKRVVIVGMGFGGLETARHLAGKDFEVIVIDRHNYHLFQPLLYQVATAELNVESIAYPIRAIIREWKNVHQLREAVVSPWLGPPIFRSLTCYTGRGSRFRDPFLGLL